MQATLSLPGQGQAAPAVAGAALAKGLAGSSAPVVRGDDGFRHVLAAQDDAGEGEDAIAVIPPEAVAEATTDQPGPTAEAAENPDASTAEDPSGTDATAPPLAAFPVSLLAALTIRSDDVQRQAGVPASAPVSATFADGTDAAMVLQAAIGQDEMPAPDLGTIAMPPELSAQGATPLADDLASLASQRHLTAAEPAVSPLREAPLPDPAGDDSGTTSLLARLAAPQPSIIASRARTVPGSGEGGIPQFWSLRIEDHAAAPAGAVLAGAEGEAVPLTIAVSVDAADMADPPGTAPQMPGSAPLPPPPASTLALPPANPSAGHAPLPAALFHDLAAAISREPDGPIELRLSPEELGRLRITLWDDPGGLRVVIHVERDGTLDLLRRNADLLGQELRAAGIPNSSLDFAGWSGARNGAATPGGAADPADLPPSAALPAIAPPPHRSVTGASGLDLRL